MYESERLVTFVILNPNISHIYTSKMVFLGFFSLKDLV